MKMNESGNLSGSVPLSRVLGGGTPGQSGKGGTPSGTVSGTHDLKALVRAKRSGTASGTPSGTPEKTLSRRPEASGTLSAEIFERNRQVLAGQNEAPAPVENAPETSAPPPEPADPSNEYADFMPPASPLQCFACSCWQKVPGLAWWCGRCVVTGRKINMQSRCDRGLEEWQSSPLPERTAPQPGGRRANRY